MENKKLTNKEATACVGGGGGEMDFVRVHFELLEKIQPPEKNESSVISVPTPVTDNVVAQNLALLREYQNEEPRVIIAALCEQLDLSTELAEQIVIMDASAALEYAIRLAALLHTLTKCLNFETEDKEQLISLRQTRLWQCAIMEVACCAFQPQVYGQNYAALRLLVEFFSYMLTVNEFRRSRGIAAALHPYIGAIFRLKLAAYEGQLQITDPQPIHTYLDEQLNYVWNNHDKPTFFIWVLAVKAEQSAWLRGEQQRHITNKLAMAGGFAAFAHAMQRNAELVAGIVATPTKTPQYQAAMIRRIMQFCALCALNEDDDELPLDVGLFTLRRLYDLRTENQVLVTELLRSTMRRLLAPEDVLCGLVVMAHSDLQQLIQHWHQLFCSSSIACLPSALLVDYLLFFLQLYDSLPPKLAERRLLMALVTRCLDNREPKAELADLIGRLYNPSSQANWLSLHKRLSLVPDESCTEVSVTVMSADYQPEFNVSAILPELLLGSQHNPLIYKVFMVLLRLLAQQLEAHERSGGLLTNDESELCDFLAVKYQMQLDLLLSLNVLVAHAPLITQLAANLQPFVEFLRELLQSRMRCAAAANNQTADHTLIVLLALTREVVEQTSVVEPFVMLLPQLAKFQQHNRNQLLNQSIDMLKQRLHSSGKQRNGSIETQAFDNARQLVEASEPYMQVYGIDTLKKLLDAKDKTALGQIHVIIALGLTKLKQKESYIFLNCVRLFVAAVQAAESEVIELLAGEYLSETAAMDYRLVVGETIVKVCQYLGPFCYKHKSALLNCFMDGVRSPLDEFRMSAWSNLAQMCRLLTYQVQHFFQQLLQLIDAELTFGKYVPAQRAAVYLLSELLTGMENLVDYQDLLLPVYRLLRELAHNERYDEKLRQHALNGLQTLNEKCRNLLLAAQQQGLEREIKVLGIADNDDKQSAKNSLKSCIWDLNLNQ